MGVLFLFIDGIGIGPSSAYNPFSVRDFEGFQQLTGGERLTIDAPPISTSDLVFRSVDATLGVDGLPQSGTGQATLFSGENASAMIGKHFGPYPHTGIKVLLQERSLFHQVQQMGKRPYFMNAFPEIFFERASLRNRWSCATLMTRSAGLKINSVEEVFAGKALTAEILQDYWKKMLNLEVPAISYDEASKRVLNALDEYDVVLMEYYLTDKAGHAQKLDDAVLAIERIDKFIYSFLSNNNTHTMVVCSDHGNIEDLSIKTHTVNNVPLIVSGPAARNFINIEDLKGVTPSILASIE
ncbi:MAG: hypothetical protein LAT57_07965 [Balneolales bacterium]|nr:hypothetical protein [Balneolales bacterium]